MCGQTVVEADDVAVGTYAALDGLAKLQQHARCIGIRIGDRQRLVGLEILDVSEPCRGVVDEGPVRCGFRFLCRKPDDGQSRCGHDATAQELAPAHFDHLVTSFHGMSPIEPGAAYAERALPVICIARFSHEQFH